MKSRVLLLFIVTCFYSCQKDIHKTIYLKEIKSNKFDEIYQLYTLHNSDTLWYPFTFSDSKILVNDDSVKNLSFSIILEQLNEVLPTFIERNIKRQKLSSNKFYLKIPNQLLNDFNFEIDKELYHSRIDNKILNKLKYKADSSIYKTNIILNESNFKSYILNKLSSDSIHILELWIVEEEKPPVGYTDDLLEIVSFVENSTSESVKFSNKFDRFWEINIRFGIDKKQ